MRNPMPLSGGALALGLRHNLAGWQRALFRLSANRFVGRLRQAGVSLEPSLTAAGTQILCYTCGHALVSVTLVEGWRLELCSAAVRPERLNPRQLVNWCEQSVLGKAATSHLQRSGH
jgi:hypothetical protein